MARPLNKKRPRAENEPRRPKKKIRKQKDYHSSSEGEEDDNGRPPTQRSVTKDSYATVPGPKSILKQRKIEERAESEHLESDLEAAYDLDEVERNTALNTRQDDGSEDEEDSENDGIPRDEAMDMASDSDADDNDDSASDESASVTSSNAPRTQKKRNDPTAFATSISKILSTKLSNSKRPDPVLSRSKAASETTKALADAKLEQKARNQLRQEKKQALDKGRVTDVLGLETPGVDTGRLMEEEKRLKKTAQRGVVKLFNAVRAAQVRADEARNEGIVGMKKREERVNEMSKEGFLELIRSGGKSGAVA